MVDSDGNGSRSYLNFLDDEEDSDNEDGSWKRKKSPSSPSSTSTGKNRNRCVFDDSGDSGFERKVVPTMRNLNFEEENDKPLPSITRTITRTIETNKLPASVSPDKPSTSKETSSSPEPVWKRLFFPGVRAKRDELSKSSQPSTSTQRVIITSIVPPPSLSSDSELSTPLVNRKSITSPSASNSGDVRTRLGPVTSDTSKETTPVHQQRPPIPDNLDFKPAHFAPPRPKYPSERDIDLPTFVKQLKAEMLFHQSLDRIYNRSMRELSAMKAMPEFQDLVKIVIEGVLFDPEVQLNEDTVHRILRLLDIFDLDHTATWTFLIDHSYNLIIKSTEAHYVRMAKFIEMSFNHLFEKKIRLLPATALSLFKLAQVRPFDPEKKPSARVKPGTIKADLSGIY